MSDNYVLKLYNRFKGFPGGLRFFSWFSARRAPYFATISPLITRIEPGVCHVNFKKRRKVENHIKTVHVIAICNGLEMAMGFMAEASIPKHLRWIPKGMTLDYTAKANTDIRCEAVLENNEWKEGDLPVSVKAYDIHGTVVVSGTINLWVSAKTKK